MPGSAPSAKQIALGKCHVLDRIRAMVVMLFDAKSNQFHFETSSISHLQRREA